eukprot:7333279-Alexandrium_andersonii.AAC.1
MVNFNQVDQRGLGKRVVPKLRMSENVARRHPSRWVNLPPVPNRVWVVPEHGDDCFARAMHIN